MNVKLSERLRVLRGVTPQDITTDRTGSWHDVSGARRFMAELLTATVASGQAATVELLQAQDSSGTGSKALAAAVSATAGSGGEELAATVEAKASDLDDGFTHVAVKVTCDDPASGGIQGSATLILGDNRFNP